MNGSNERGTEKEQNPKSESESRLFGLVDLEAGERKRIRRRISY